jgi:carboxypeptidase Q
MKLILTFFFSLATVHAALGQQTAPTPVLYSEKTLNELQAIQHAALAGDYALKQTAYLSNNIGPRLTGSPQAERAVEYVADEMRKLA